MTQAMGALNAVVGSGDMRMQDLADALGTGVLSVVKGFGLSLNDVGAALATFGDNNIRGADAATALRMAVMSLAKPAVAGADAIDKLGLQSDTLAKAMQRGGLNAALTLLHDRLKATGNTGNKTGLILTEAFGKKAGIGLQVLEDQFARFQSKVEEVGKGAKGFDASWAATTKTFSYRFDAMRAAVEALGIRIGTVLLPVASDLLVAITGIGKAASTTVGFLKNHQTAVEALAAVYAATLIPKLVMLAVAQARVIGEDIAIRFMYARDAATKFAGSLTPLKIGLIAVAIAAIDVFNSWRSIDSAVKDARQSLKDAANVGNYSSFTDFASNAESQYQQLTATADTMYAHLSANPFANLSTAVNAYSGHLADARGKIIDAAAAQRQLVGNVEAVTQALGAVPTSGNMQQTFEVMQRALADNAISVDDLTGNWQTLRDKLQGYIVTSGGTTNATKAVANAIIGLQSPAKDAQAAIDDLTTAFKGLVSAPISADEAAAKFIGDLQALEHAAHRTTRSISLFTKAGRDNREKIRGLAGDVTDLVSRWVDEGKTVDQIRPKLLQHEKALERVAIAFTGNKKAADALLRRWHLLPDQINEIAGALHTAVGKAAATAKDGGEKTGAALSAGVKAGQLAKHQALDEAVDNLNASIKTGGGKAAAAAKQTGLDIGSGLDAGVMSGISAQRQQVLDYAFSLGQDAANATKRGAVVKSPSKITTYVGKMIAQGLITGFDGAAGKVYDHLSGSTRRLLDKLAADIQNAKSFRSSLRDSLLGYADITGATDSGVSVGGYLKAKLNDLRKFAHDLARLSRMGLAPALLNQIAQAGPGALPVAEELLHMGRKGIPAIDHTERQIQHYAGQAAATVTRDEYGSKIHDDLQKLPDKIAHAIKKHGAIKVVHPRRLRPPRRQLREGRLMAATLQFVDSIGASPTLRLDINDGTIWLLEADGTDFSPPGLKTATADIILNDGAYRPRRPTRTAGSSSACPEGHQRGRQGDQAPRVARRAQPQLQHPQVPARHHAAVLPHAPRAGVRPRRDRDIRAHLRRPRHRGRAVRLRAAGRPDRRVGEGEPGAGTNGCYLDVNGVTGDVETPAYIALSAGTVTAGSLSPSYMSVRRHGTPATLQFIYQAESVTQAIDTAVTASNDATASGAGNNTSTTTFATQTPVTNRLAVTLSEGVETHGKFRVLVRVAKTVATDTFTLGMSTGSGLQLPVTSITQTTQLGPALHDLGLVQFPEYADPVNSGYGSALPVSAWTNVGINVGRTSGTGSLDLDYLLLVPADEAYLAANSTFIAGNNTVIDGPNGSLYVTASGNLSGVKVTWVGGIPSLTPGATNRLWVFPTTEETAPLTETTTITVESYPRYLVV
jgi:hypothetical protein